VHGAALVPGLWRYLLQRLPEAEGAIAGGQFRRDDQAAGLEIDQQFPELWWNLGDG
jgi:hypothetical protein